MIDSTDAELSERLQDLLAGFERAYTWHVAPYPKHEFGRVLRITLFSGDLAVSHLVSRRQLDSMTISLWDFADLRARVMVSELRRGWRD